MQYEIVFKSDRNVHVILAFLKVLLLLLEQLKLLRRRLLLLVLVLVLGLVLLRWIDVYS